LAGYTISIRVIIFTILPAWGIANAASTLVGQHLGAGQPDEAERSTWLASRYTMYFMLVVAILYISLAAPIIGIFDPTPEVVAIGAQSLRIISLGYIFFAYGMVLGQAFNGSGDTRTPMILNLISFWMIEIPLAWYLSSGAGLGPDGVFVAVAISESILAVLCIILFRRGKWKLTVI
ncbi:MAG TPA: MATE family efflux transporter, partial [Saprospiraceae bacterium]|nr:MATE family efflux transporter [Saprospiraceae bacterium]